MIKRIIILLFVLSTLISCSKDGGDDFRDDKIIGTWIPSKEVYRDDGSIVILNDEDLIADEIIMTYHEDGTFVGYFIEPLIEGKWENVGESTYSFEAPGQSPWEVTYEFLGENEKREEWDRIDPFTGEIIESYKYYLKDE